MAPLLREIDLIRADGSIDLSTLMRIAARRARIEREGFAKIGHARAWADLLGVELRRTWSIVRDMLAARRARAEFAALPVTEQHARQAEHTLSRLRDGMAHPANPAAIERAEAEVAAARIPAAA